MATQRPRKGRLVNCWLSENEVKALDEYVKITERAIEKSTGIRSAITRTDVVRLAIRKLVGVA